MTDWELIYQEARAPKRQQARSLQCHLEMAHAALCHRSRSIYLLQDRVHGTGMVVEIWPMAKDNLSLDLSNCIIYLDSALSRHIDMARVIVWDAF